VPLESLALLQQRFLALASQPAPVADAAFALARADNGASPIARWVRGVDEDQAAERLAVYARMYFSRLLESLREDYPKVAAVLGAKMFEQVVADYLLAHPSREPSLHRLGHSMSQFLTTHPLTCARPELADLARLEWARLEVFGASNVTVLNECDFASRAQQGLACAELRLVPACRLVFVWHSVNALWSAIDRDQAVPSVAPRAETMLVWRREFQVRHRVLPHDEAAGLRLLQSGARLSAVCGALAQSGEDIDAAATRAFRVLRQWITDQLLCAGSARTTSPSPEGG
jgi:hypothetical protein